MGTQQSVPDGASTRLFETGMGYRLGSQVPLSGSSLPLNQELCPSLPRPMTTRVRPVGIRRRQRPLSCVISDPGNAGLLGNQIIVVSSGPRNLYRSTSSPKVLGSSGRWREDPQWEVYQLEHRVPKFEPLAKWRDFEGPDPTPLIEMVEIYKRHYATAADTILHKQDEIIRLERKLECDSKRALELMKLRQRGGGFQTSSPHDALTPLSAPMTTVKAGGIYQLRKISKGIEELNNRFKTCDKLLNELKLEAAAIDRVLTPDCEQGKS